MLFQNVDVDGLNIFYREAGNETAPKLVLLHGFPASSHQYRNLIPALAEGLARSIVSYREANGPFRTRAVLKKIPRLGPKAFELSAGFLRIREGDDPLDASGVPDARDLVTSSALSVRARRPVISL
jgi:pimeloyl-ACP methyl ester carboxylesterase